MIIYFWALFLAPQNVKFLDRTIRDWALVIPVMIIVYLFLVVVAWIGWAMATTPPSIPSLRKNPKDDEKEDKAAYKKSQVFTQMCMLIFAGRL